MKVHRLFAFLLFVAADAHAFIQRVVFNADVVASGCHAVVDVDGVSGGRLIFDTFRKATMSPVPSRDFTVRLYEAGASIEGCSAFLVGRVATLSFGNQGQLDARGVVTRGAGDGIRIDVRAVDAQADFREALTLASHKVNYPVEVAARGVFRFRVRPVFPEDVRAGEYSGALTFVVSYQ